MDMNNVEFLWASEEVSGRLGVKVGGRKSVNVLLSRLCCVKATWHPVRGGEGGGGFCRNYNDIRF